jgi:hypothetical protein
VAEQYIQQAMARFAGTAYDAWEKKVLPGSVAKAKSKYGK